jgi:hypothetical protein
MAEKSVIFYECLDVQKHPTFDCKLAIKGINSLPDPQWRVTEPSIASDLAVIVDQEATSTKPAHLRFLRIREDAPFKLDAARQLAPVEVAQNEAITEFTWLVLWPDHYLAGVNMRDAPTHKKLQMYFNATSGQQTHIVNLFRPDVLKQLKEMQTNGSLRKLQVSVRMSELENLASKKSLTGFKSILAAGKEADALTLDVTLSIGRGHPEEALSNGVATSAVELAGSVDLLESMNVIGIDAQGERREINLKQERLGGAINLEASSTNAAIFREIEKVRGAVEGEIGPMSKAARGK